MKRELWKEVDGENTYLIPKGIALEAGKFEIENKSGYKMLVSEASIREYICHAEDITEHKSNELEDSIINIGKAFGGLFETGKALFLDSLRKLETDTSSEEERSSEDVLEFSEEENNANLSDSDEDRDEISEEEIPDNVVDLNAEDSDETFTKFAQDVDDIVTNSIGELRSFFKEAQKGLKKSLKEEDTQVALRQLGQQIIAFANSLNEEEFSSESDKEHTEEEAISSDAVEMTIDPISSESTEPPPAPQDAEQNEDTPNDTDIPPDPLPDQD